MNANRVLVEYVAIGHGRRGDAVNSSQQHTVPESCRAPQSIEFVEVRQLYPEQRGLECVEAGIVAQHFILVAPEFAVIAEPARHVGHVVVTRDEQPAVAECAEVLGRVKGKCAGVAERPRHPAFDRPADVDHLLADASKAKRDLDWEPQVTFEELIRMMVDADLKALGG